MYIHIVIKWQFQIVQFREVKTEAKIQISRQLRQVLLSSVARRFVHRKMAEPPAKKKKGGSQNEDVDNKKVQYHQERLDELFETCNAGYRRYAELEPICCPVACFFTVHPLERPRLELTRCRRVFTPLVLKLKIR